MRTPKVSLSTPEKIALCGIMLLGYDVCIEAFLLCHPRTKTDNQTSLNVMASRWHASKLCKSFRADMIAKISRISAESGADLRSREGIIDTLISATQQTTGKDTVSALQSLAKLQGFDRPAQDELQEQRTFFLPYRSKCRTCALMRVFRELHNTIENDTPSV